MKKIILSTALIMAATVYAKSSAPIQKEELATMNFFKNKGIKVLGTAAMENTDITVVSFVAQTPQGEQRMNAFVPKGKEYVIVGGGYKDQTGEQVTVPMDMGAYKQDAGITVGNGKKEIYIFTDPECPYCIKMDKEVLSGLSLDEYTIRIYMFPLSFHPNAESMSMYIMSKKTETEKLKALHAISNGSKEFLNASYTENERTKLKAALSKQMQVAQTLGVNGTPSLFDSNGASINWTTLLTPKR